MRMAVWMACLLCRRWFNTVAGVSGYYDGLKKPALRKASITMRFASFATMMPFCWKACVAMERTTTDVNGCAFSSGRLPGSAKWKAHRLQRLIRLKQEYCGRD